MQNYVIAKPAGLWQSPPSKKSVLQKHALFAYTVLVHSVISSAGSIHTT
jgi:hypothetical protein